MSRFHQIGIALAFGFAGYWLGRGHAPEPQSPLTNTRSKPLFESLEKLRPPDERGGSSESPQSHSNGSAQALLDEAAAIPDRSDAEYFLRRSLDALPADQFSSFAADLARMPKSYQLSLYGQILMTQFIRRWTNTDQEAVTQWIKRLPDEKDRLKALQTAVSEIATTDPSSAFRLLGAESGTIDYWNSKLFHYWAQQNLPEALAALTELEGSEHSAGSVALLNGLAERDPLAALAAAETLLEDPDRTREKIFEGWAQNDPAAAATWLKSLPTSERGSVGGSGTVFTRLFYSAVYKDPNLAISLLDGMPEHARRRGVAAIADGWGSKNFDAAWTWAQSLTNMTEQNEALSSLGGAARKLDATQLLELANQITSDYTRLEFLRGGFDSHRSAEQDPQRLIDVLQTLEPSWARQILQDKSIMANVTDRNPAEAARILDKLDLDVSDPNWKILAEAWGKKDSSVAYEWASSLPEEFASLRQPIVREMARKAPATALEIAQSLEHESDRQRITEDVFGVWSYSDLDGFELAATQMSGQLRTDALNLILSRKLHSDPAAAAEQFMQLRDSPLPEDAAVGNGRNFFHQIGGSWVVKDRAEALEWMSELPTEEMRTAAISGMAARWASHDSMSASKWIVDLPPGPATNAAVTELVEVIQATDPQSALIWVEQISDTKSKDRLTQSALQNLVERDPTAGRQAVIESNLPEEVKSSLLDD